MGSGVIQSLSCTNGCRALALALARVHHNILDRPGTQHEVISVDPILYHLTVYWVVITVIIVITDLACSDPGTTQLMSCVEAVPSRSLLFLLYTFALLV